MAAMDAGLPPPFQFRCPDVAGALAQCENQLVRAGAGTEDGLVHLVACAMEMSDIKRRPGRPPGIPVQTLRPDALKAVPFRQEIQHAAVRRPDRKSTRLNSSHVRISYAVFCLKKKKKKQTRLRKIKQIKSTKQYQ